MRNEIESDGFVTPERYITKNETKKTARTGRDVVLASLAKLDNCDLVGYVAYYMFGFDTEIEFEEYLNKEVTE